MVSTQEHDDGAVAGELLVEDEMPVEPTVRLKGVPAHESPASDATTDEDRDPPPPPGT